MDSFNPYYVHQWFNVQKQNLSKGGDMYNPIYLKNKVKRFAVVAQVIYILHTEWGFLFSSKLVVSITRYGEFTLLSHTSVNIKAHIVRLLNMDETVGVYN